MAFSQYEENRIRAYLKNIGVLDVNGRLNFGVVPGLVSLSGAQTLSNKTLDSPIFTGTPTGLSKAHVGLDNVDNTSDANKPISVLTASALSAKQNILQSGTNIKTLNGVSLLGSGDIVLTPGGGGSGDVTLNDTQTLANKTLASPVFTGTPTGLTKAHVGLGSVDNTSDAAKPISTAVASALTTKLEVSTYNTNRTADQGTVTTGLNALDARLDVLEAQGTVGVDAWTDDTYFNGDFSEGSPLTIDTGVIATVAYVDGQISTVSTSVSNLTTTVSSKAPLASPTFTGTPTVPTATAGTNTTQIASTAFVQTALAAVGSSSTTVTSITSGSATTLSTTSGEVWALVNPSATLPAHAITLPPTSSGTQTVTISFGGSLTSGVVVTSLSILPNSGQTLLQATTPGSVRAGETIAYRYLATASRWYRLY